MPSYKGHIIGGLAVYLLIMMSVVVYKFLPIQSVPQLAKWLVCTLVGALFPDLDIKSIGQKWFYRFIALISLLLLAYEQQHVFTMVSLCGLIPLLVSHRGMLHRWWFIGMVAMFYVFTMTYFVPNYYHAAVLDASFFSAGAASHLWLDGGWRLLFRIR